MVHHGLYFFDQATLVSLFCCCAAVLSLLFTFLLHLCCVCRFFFLHRAVITGGSSGIGAAMAKRLAAQGMNLVLLASRPDPLNKTAEEIRKYAAKSERIFPFIILAADCSRCSAFSPLCLVFCFLSVSLSALLQAISSCGSSHCCCEPRCLS